MFMHKKNIVALVFGLLITGIAAATTVTLQPNHPERYVVVEGDTLWDIASRFLKDPWLWPEIWHVNPEIDNPHLIYPGDVIRLVYVDGRPQLRIERGRPTVKLSPEVRATPLRRAIPTIPLDAIRQFLTEPRVVSDEELDAAPYLVQSAGEHLVAAAGNRIYVRGVADESQSRFTVVRKGEVYTDPDTGEVLGREALFVGDAAVERFGDPATMQITRSKSEARIGDRLLPAVGENFDASFQPRAPAQEVHGRIIAVLGGVSQIGQHQVVVVNRGQREGMEPGHVLAVYQKGATVMDTVTEDPDDTVTLPDERAGVMMVFRTFEKVSYGLIMRATTNMHVLDVVRNP